MKRYILAPFVVSSITFASQVKLSDIDPKKSIIQLGIYSQQSTLDQVLKKMWSQRSFYIKETDGRYILYAVNINKKSQKKVLRALQNITKDAFIKPNGYSLIQNSKKTLLDTNKVVIQIGIFSKKQSIENLHRQLDTQYDTYVIEEAGRYKFLVINIDPNEKYSALTKMRNIAKDAFIYNKTIVIDQKDTHAPIEEIDLYETNTQDSYHQSTTNTQMKNPQKPVSLIESKNEKPSSSTHDLEEYANIYTTRTTQQTSSDLYKQALSLFKNKEYKQAYTLFSEVFKTNMKDKRINFYLGRSAYEIGEYKVALGAFERVLMVEPTNARVKLEIAQTHLKLKQYSQAKKVFQESLTLNMPQKVKKRVEANIQAIDQKTKKHFINTTLVFGMSYDSNLNNSPEAGDYTIYLPQTGSNLTVSNNNKEISGTSIQTVGVLNHLYKLQDNIALNTSYTAFYQKYLNHKEKDIHALSIYTSPTYYDKEYKIMVGVGIDKVFLAHKPYLTSLSITPKYFTMFDEKTSIETALKISKKFHDKTQDKDRNSMFYEWQNTMQYNIDQYGLMRFDLNLGKEIETNDIRTDISKDIYTLGIAHTYNISKDLFLSSSLQYKNSNYKDTDVNFLSARKDQSYDLNLNLMKIYSDNLSFTLGGNYIINNSNHYPFDYDKYSMKINAIYGF